MNVGYLGIPKLESSSAPLTMDVSTKLYFFYSQLVDDEDIGKQYFEVLEADERVKKLDGEMISDGSGASRFSIKELAMWYLWATNEFGEAKAKKNLNVFLDSDELTLLNILFVLGVEVEQTIKIIEGVSITPISELPMSRVKENCDKIDFTSIGQSVPKPKTAITSLVNVNRVKVNSTTADVNEKYWECTNQLHDVSLALNTLHNVSCVPCFSTTISLSHMPFGPFSGSGGSYRHYDIIGQGTTKIRPNQSETVEMVLAKLSSKRGKEKSKYTRILSRLSQSKRRHDIEDKILDLCIALEMALLDDNNNQQLSLTFRLRGSWLIAKDEEDRLSKYRDLRDIYSYRSQVAHSGVLSSKDVENAFHSFSRYMLIAEEIVLKLICEDKPDWSKLVLGFS